MNFEYEVIYKSFSFTQTQSKGQYILGQYQDYHVTEQKIEDEEHKGWLQFR